MNTLTSKIIRTLSIIAIAVTASSFNVRATDNRAPETPTRITVEEGHKVHFHAYAVGVQIYVCRETAPGVFEWVFKAPEAVLYDNDENIVGIHYGGPTWESNSGSFVIGARVDGVTVDPTAIPWLLLRNVNNGGPGVFAKTKFIQRINTVGGLAPAPSTATAANVGEEVRIPYTADYFFYRAE